MLLNPKPVFVGVPNVGLDPLNMVLGGGGDTQLFLSNTNGVNLTFLGNAQFIYGILPFLFSVLIRK